MSKRHKQTTRPGPGGVSASEGGSPGRRPLPIEQREPGPAGPALYLLRGLLGKGFLVVPVQEGLKLIVELKPAQVRLLYTLLLAWRADGELPPAVRGWRQADEVGQAHGDLLPMLLPVAGSTVVSYASRLQRLIELLAGEDGWDGPAPVVVQRERGKGYRLGIGGLTVVGLSQPDGNADADGPEA